MEERERVVLPEGTKLPWYKKPSYVWAVAFLLFALAQITTALTLYHISNTQSHNTNTIDQTQTIVTKIDQNQVGIDELVTFKHELEASQQGGYSQAVANIEALLCAIDDPIRQQACAELGIPTK